MNTFLLSRARFWTLVFDFGNWEQMVMKVSFERQRKKDLSVLWFVLEVSSWPPDLMTKFDLRSNISW